MPFSIFSRLRAVTAQWRNLVWVTYAVRPGRVAGRLPEGLVPDVQVGRTFVSLVALQMARTRVFGIPVPVLGRFPQLALHLPVYHPATDTRGAIAVRAFVPSRLVAGAVRRGLHEPYTPAPLTHTHRPADDVVNVAYRLDRADRRHHLRVSGMRPAGRPAVGSLARAATTFGWGFATHPDGRLLRYAVDHPPWAVYPVDAWHLSLDWAAVYGADWAFLQNAEPASVLLSPGSRVRVSSVQAVASTPRPSRREPVAPL